MAKKKSTKSVSQKVTAHKKRDDKTTIKSTPKKVTAHKIKDNKITVKLAPKKTKSLKPSNKKSTKVISRNDINSSKIFYSKTASNSLSSLNRIESRAVKKAVETLKQSKVKKEIVYKVSSGKLKGNYVVKSGKYRAIVEKSATGVIRVKDIINRNAQSFYTK